MATRSAQSFDADHTSASSRMLDLAAAAARFQFQAAFAAGQDAFLGTADQAAADAVNFGNLSDASQQPNTVQTRRDESSGSPASRLPPKESLVLGGPNARARRIVEREGGVSAANPMRFGEKAMKIGLGIDESYLEEIKADMASPTGGTKVRPVHLNAWLSVPDVILLVNPASLDWSLTNTVQETRTRGGFMQEFWGSELDTLSASGTTATAYVASFDPVAASAGSGAAAGAAAGSLLGGLGTALGALAGGIIGGLNPKGRRQGGGLTIRDLRSDSAGYRNLRRLVDVYRSNGIIYGMRAMGNYAVGNGPEQPAFRKALLYGGYVSILYDGITYRGFFENFEIREAGDAPFWLEWNFTFKVESHVGKDLKMYDSGKFLGKPASAQDGEFESLANNTTLQRNT